jgi:hypothetical protein
MAKSFERKMIEEKGLLEACFNVTVEGVFHHIEMEVLLQFIESIKDVHIKKTIRNTLSIIDFKNGDIMHYMTHLAEGFALTQNREYELV